MISETKVAWISPLDIILCVLLTIAVFNFFKSHVHRMITVNYHHGIAQKHVPLQPCTDNNIAIDS